MIYMPLRGEIVSREFIAKPILNIPLNIVAKAYALALDYWDSVIKDDRISEDFRQLSRKHRTGLSQASQLYLQD